MNKLELQTAILNRAKAMGITWGDRMTQAMDIMNADDQFDLDMEDWLNADDGNFAHDFIGIQNHMNRETMRCENFFVPRFAYRERRHAHD